MNQSPDPRRPWNNTGDRSFGEVGGAFLKGTWKGKAAHQRDYPDHDLLRRWEGGREERRDGTNGERVVFMLSMEDNTTPQSGERHRTKVDVNYKRGW